MMTVYNVASISNTTFAGNTNITSVDLSGIPIVGNDCSRMFNGCTNLQYVYRLNKNVTRLWHAFEDCQSLIESPIIPDGVYNLGGTYFNCYGMTKTPIIPESVTYMDDAFFYCHSITIPPILPTNITSLRTTFCACYNLTSAPVIPNNVTDMYGTFWGCNRMSQAPIVPENVTNVKYLFASCTNLTGDITIKSTEITNAVNCFLYTSSTKNVYMPITYANGINTATYNSFIAAGYDTNGTTNGVYIKDIDSLRIPNWNWTESGNKVTLTSYTGANNVVVPNVETLRNL